MVAGSESIVLRVTSFTWTSCQMVVVSVKVKSMLLVVLLMTIVWIKVVLMMECGSRDVVVLMESFCELFLW